MTSASRHKRLLIALLITTAGTATLLMAGIHFYFRHFDLWYTAYKQGGEPALNAAAPSLDREQLIYRICFGAFALGLVVSMVLARALMVLRARNRLGRRSRDFEVMATER